MPILGIWHIHHMQSRDALRDWAFGSAMVVPTTEKCWKSGQNASLWWMTMVRMTKNDGISRVNCLGKKGGIHPPPKNAKSPGKRPLTMVLTP